MANVVRAALSRAVKAGTFGKGLGYDSSKTSGGETLDPRTDIASSETAAAADLTTHAAASDPHTGYLLESVQQLATAAAVVLAGTDMATATGLPSFTAVASKGYLVELFLRLDPATQADGLDIDFTVPTNGTFEIVTVAAGGIGADAQVGTAGTEFSNADVGGTDYALYLVAFVEGGDGGTVQMRAAKTADVGADSTIKRALLRATLLGT